MKTLRLKLAAGAAFLGLCTIALCWDAYVLNAEFDGDRNVLWGDMINADADTTSLIERDFPGETVSGVSHWVKLKIDNSPADEENDILISSTTVIPPAGLFHNTGIGVRDSSNNYYVEGNGETQYFDVAIAVQLYVNNTNTTLGDSDSWLVEISE